MTAEDLLAAVRLRQEWPPERRAAARRNSGASLRDVGRVVGVSHVAVRIWESGENNPRTWELERQYLELLTALEEAVQ